MKSPIKSWSDAKFKGWIISLLRRGTMRWPPRNEALAKAKTEKKINTATGRMAQHYECAECKGQFTAKNIAVDHIQAVIDPYDGFIDFSVYIERMFCGVDNLQVLCKDCHDVKSAKEKGHRKTNSRTGN